MLLAAKGDCADDDGSIGVGGRWVLCGCCAGPGVVAVVVAQAVLRVNRMESSVGDGVQDEYAESLAVGPGCHPS